MSTSTQLNDTADWAELVREHRPYLLAIAYRMLGSRSDAEDILQETWLRARESAERVHNPRAYLATIVVRLCIDDTRSARARRETYVGPWLPEPIVENLWDDGGTAASADKALLQRESISMAFLVVLETLSPLERAVFVLREVFDYDFQEIAIVLGRTPAACRQLHHRASQHVNARKHRFDPDHQTAEKLVMGFLAALSQGDAAVVASLLAEDVTSTSDGGGEVKAALNVVEGRDRVTRFMLGLKRKAASGLSVEARLINGEQGIILRDADGKIFNVMVFHVEHGAIRGIYSIVSPSKLQTLGA